MDLEGTVDIVIEVVAARGGDGCSVYGVADAVGVEIAAGHGVGFVVNDAVEGTIDHRVYTEGEDVLMVGCEDTGVNDCSPWDGKTFVNWLGREDTSGADLVHNFSGLVELEGENILVICNGDYGLKNKLSVANDCCAASSVVGVFPSDTVILLVNADYVWHIDNSSFIVTENSGEVVD